MEKVTDDRRFRCKFSISLTVIRLQLLANSVFLMSDSHHFGKPVVLL